MLLVLSGPVAVGKTSVGEELSEILNRRSIPHTFVDFDQLRYTYPRLPEDPWANELGLQNLQAVWQNCERRGARNLVLATVVEEQGFIDALSDAIPNSKVTTFQLLASPQTLRARVEKREIGSGLDWHRKRALELQKILSEASVPCDYRLDTEAKTIAELAEEIANTILWER